jgi:hypothetical protein
LLGAYIEPSSPKAGIRLGDFGVGRELAATALGDALGNCGTRGIIFGWPIRIIGPALRYFCERLRAFVRKLRQTCVDPGFGPGH